MKINRLYDKLLEKHGHQGWWPLLHEDNGEYSIHYHKGDYNYPRNSEEQLEIILGAILTQNTNWKNVIKALINLKRAGIKYIEDFSKLSDEELKELIKPSGYYNQKTRKLRECFHLLERLGDNTPTRDELLGVWGIGPETSDSILLYSYNVPVMVIDAYTYKVFTAEGLIEKKPHYEELRNICEYEIGENVIKLQEFHALIVAEGKEQ